MMSLTWLEFLIVFFLYVHIISIVISLYVHRSLGHRAVKFHPALETVFQTILWMTFYQPNNYSIAHHLLHHKFADNPTKDPAEVPKIQNKFYFYFKKPIYLFFVTTLFSKVIPIPTGNLLKNFKAQKEEKTKIVIEYGQSLINRAPLVIHLSIFNNTKLGAWLFILLNVLLFGWTGWLLVFLISFVLTYLGVIYIDGFVHLFGYRNYNTKDNSKNFMPWSLFTGEELHNNHHAIPSSANFAHRWFEFDIGYFYIYIFKQLGLATDWRKT